MVFASADEEHVHNPLLGQPQGAENPSGEWGTSMQPFYRPGANPTVDNIILCGGQILLIQRSYESDACPGQWALPGGFHDTYADKGEPWQPGLETARQAALRELAEETSLDLQQMEGMMEYVGFFDDRSRDIRNSDIAWSVSNAFLIHLPQQYLDRVEAGDDARDARWVELIALKDIQLAFDHKDMVRRAGLI